MMEQDEKATVAKRILVRAFDSANDAKSFLSGKKDPKFNLVDVFNNFQYMYKETDSVTRLKQDGYTYYIPMPIEELEAILVAREDVEYIDIRAFRDGEKEPQNVERLRSPNHG